MTLDVPLDIPWWTRSPSPMTLLFFLLLILLGTRQFHPDSKQEWIRDFSKSTFLLGLVVLPFDILWCLGSGLKWHSLYPDDYSWLFSILRDVGGIVFCVLECATLIGPKGPIRLNQLKWISILVVFLVVQFTLAPNPNWTDWTYGLRFGYPTSEVISSYLIGFPTKLLYGLIYLRLWKPLMKFPE